MKDNGTFFQTVVAKDGCRLIYKNNTLSKIVLKKLKIHNHTINITPNYDLSVEETHIIDQCGREISTRFLHLDILDHATEKLNDALNGEYPLITCFGETEPMQIDSLFAD